MVALIRLFVLGFLALSLVYLMVRTYARSVRRERFEKEWDAAPPVGAGKAERRQFIEDGMRAYDHGLKKRLLWLIYILPMIALVVIVYYVNAQ
ncbi:MAG: hypothetical protein ORN49_14535 [Rhodobacteraceae bacterium]|nr:hypothetical protein [Paracoccaceae bacterium]